MDTQYIILVVILLLLFISQKESFTVGGPYTWTDRNAKSYYQLNKDLGEIHEEVPFTFNFNNSKENSYTKDEVEDVCRYALKILGDQSNSQFFLLRFNRIRKLTDNNGNNFYYIDFLCTKIGSHIDTRFLLKAYSNESNLYVNSLARLEGTMTVDPNVKPVSGIEDTIGNPYLIPDGPLTGVMGTSSHQLPPGEKYSSTGKYIYDNYGQKYDRKGTAATLDWNSCGVLNFMPYNIRISPPNNPTVSTLPRNESESWLMLKPNIGTRIPMAITSNTHGQHIA